MLSKYSWALSQNVRAPGGENSSDTPSGDALPSRRFAQALLNLPSENQRRPLLSERPTSLKPEFTESKPFKH